MRLWKGFLSFGLVTIPVELFSAVNKHTFGFTLLHAACKTPIKYKRWCPHCNVEVEFSHIVKGIKVHDRYVTVTPEELKKMKLAKSDIIAIHEFVHKDLVPPIYYDTHYYLAPTHQSTQKAFSVFTIALEKSKVVALGSLVLRDKEYVCILQSYDSIILLSTLNYEYELRAIPMASKNSAQTASIAELRLATQLIQKLTKKSFTISRFKDTFAQKLKAYLKHPPRARNAKRSLAPTPKPQSRTPKAPTLKHILEKSIQEQSRRSYGIAKSK